MIYMYTYRQTKLQSWRLGRDSLRSPQLPWGKMFVVEWLSGWVVEHWTTNILPTIEATLPTFTCCASSNHEYKNHELANNCWTTNILTPENYLLYGEEYGKADCVIPAVSAQRLQCDENEQRL